MRLTSYNVPLSKVLLAVAVGTHYWAEMQFSGRLDRVRVDGNIHMGLWKICGIVQASSTEAGRCTNLLNVDIDGTVPAMQAFAILFLIFGAVELLLYSIFLFRRSTSLRAWIKFFGCFAWLCGLVSFITFTIWLGNRFSLRQPTGDFLDYSYWMMVSATIVFFFTFIMIFFLRVDNVTKSRSGVQTVNTNAVDLRESREVTQQAASPSSSSIQILSSHQGTENTYQI